MTEDDAAVEIRSARKEYPSAAGPVRALDDVSLTIRKGEFFTLLGPSGCGKTTLLRLIAGFETPDAGRILLEGRDITDDPPNRRPVNTVFQSYALFPHLSVARNIAFGLEMLGRPAAETRARVAQILRLVRMEEMADRRPDQLSGGQQQRVALARALAPAPRVLLLDEPLSALDLKLRKEMQRELKRLQHETGITFVFVTHDQEEALTMSDRVGVMRGGRLQQVGPPREIYARPVNRFVADFIGETNFLEGVARGGAVHLPAGAALPAPGGAPAEGARITLTVRPEHLRLNAPGAGRLEATVAEIVYFGPAAHCHMKLDDGTPIVARLEEGRMPEPGARVGLDFAPGALQALED
ncbi:ABC transporter ATP-binding protein [Oceanicella actignis]|uniref:ABC transporter ATP-binding protein n=1 Tax=Oceanicella actignis TaxID=1189325 RepID=UPI0011E749F3|nr:spermidine/putrescine transport system ATP-binding protein [Oceanicella actignis]